MTSPASLNVPRRGLHLFLAAAVIAIAALGAASEIGQYAADNENFLGLGPLVDLDYEGNLPDWHLSMLMLFCAALLAIAGITEDASRRGGRHCWLLLATFFLFLSADHAADIDEPLTDAVFAEVARRSHLAPLAWIAVAVPLIWLAGVIATVTLRGAPWQVRALCAGAAAIYGLSLAATDWQYPVRLWFDSGGREGGEVMVRDLLGVLGHGLQTLALSLLCSALVELIARRSGFLELRLVDGDEPRPASA